MTPLPDPTTSTRPARLDDSELGGSNVEGIDIGSKASKGLLGTVWADQGVDLDGVDVVELLESLLDLALVGLEVDNEDKGVVLLNLLHGTLGVEWVNDHLVLIKTWRMWDRLAWVLWGAGQHEGLWAVEGRRVADLASLVGVGLEKMLACSV